MGFPLLNGYHNFFMETLRLLGMGAFDLDLPFFRGHIYYL